METERGKLGGKLFTPATCFSPKIDYLEKAIAHALNVVTHGFLGRTG